jgi:hypothetical protein
MDKWQLSNSYSIASFLLLVDIIACAHWVAANRPIDRVCDVLVARNVAKFRANNIHQVCEVNEVVGGRNLSKPQDASNTRCWAKVHRTDTKETHACVWILAVEKRAQREGEGGRICKKGA